VPSTLRTLVKLNGAGQATVIVVEQRRIHALGHHVTGVQLILLAAPLNSGHSYWSLVKDSGWLGHVRSVLHTSVCIVDYVVAGQGVLVHCSDGWDRTAQTCSLAGFMLDPFYRTLRGFATLVEKEWLAFGHKFSQRNGLVKDKAKEVSPIFLQFLEAAWHLSKQFPRAFEFNERLLIALHDCLHSCQFGTFLGNNERERKVRVS